MNSKIIRYLALLLIVPLATACVRVPPKPKKPQIKKVILVDYTTKSSVRFFSS